VTALSDAQRELLEEARRAVLATISPDGRPRLVPMVFAVTAADTEDGNVVLYSALDEKPKSVPDPRALARVRDVLARPRVSVLVDRWDEDWSRLAWLRLDGVAALLEPTGTAAAEHGVAVGLLRDRYPQYATHTLEKRPVMRIEIERVVGWGLEP
jgi:PPOX class probable F420-dependent enzyme